MGNLTVENKIEKEVKKRVTNMGKDAQYQHRTGINKKTRRIITCH